MWRHTEPKIFTHADPALTINEVQAGGRNVDSNNTRKITTVCGHLTTPLRVASISLTPLRYTNKFHHALA